MSRARQSSALARAKAKELTLKSVLGTADVQYIEGETVLEFVVPKPNSDEFNALASRWLRETRHLSSSDQIAMHDSYQQIIGMGKLALPLILERLAARPDRWFWALRAISKENPVTEADAGDVGKMQQAWLRWGRERRLI